MRNIFIRLNAKNWFPQGTKLIKRLYFTGFGTVTFLVPLLIFYGLWAAQETQRDKLQIQSLLRQKASAIATNVELILDQQLDRLESTALFIQDLDKTPEQLAVTIKKAGDAIRVVKYLGLVTSHGDVVGNSVPELGAVLPADVLSDVRQVSKTNKAFIKSRILNMDEPTINSAGIMLYVPTRYNGRDFVIVGALPFSYVQNIVEQYGDSDAVLAQNIVDNNRRLIARTSGIETYFGQAVSSKFEAATSRQKLEGTFETVSLDGHAILSTFRFSPTLNWYFNVSIRSDYTEKLLSRGDNFVLFTAIIGLVLFVCIGIILTINMLERQIANQQLEDEKAYSHQMRKAVQERELLLREVYHRVKNNLQVLQSILRLSIKNFSPEDRQKIEAISTRINAIAEVHTQLYKSVDLSQLDLKSYVEALVQQVSAVYRKPGQDVKLFFNAQSVPASLETAVPLGLVLVELLSNAYKYGIENRSTGTLSISLFQLKDGDKDMGVLEIEDDGTGVKSGFRATSSLGLKLVDRLSIQLNGSIEWPTEGSSRVRVYFALNSQSSEHEFPTAAHDM